LVTFGQNFKKMRAISDFQGPILFEDVTFGVDSIFSDLIFSFFRCGRVVCHSCSTQRLKIPEIYSDILVRCCDDCYRSTELALKKPRSPRNLNHTDSMFDHKLLNVEPEEDEWMLSGNTKHDQLLRDEFVYEYAPSVSLCLSICAFHVNNVECVNFLLHHCRRLQSLLGPIHPGQPNPEVDYVLVTRMLNCLILAAKVRGGEPNECNTMIDYAVIITSVVQNGCQHLLQMEPLDSSTLRRLCDSLVRADKWNLALELSLKCGFQITGIMASWGVSCLKAGCFNTAREKLSYCMQKIEDENLKNLSSLLETTLNVKGLADVVATKRPLKSPPLLVEVINVLESNRCDQQKPELMERANSITSSNILLATQKMKRKENIPMNEPALSILDAISSLKQIAKGVYTNDLKSIRSDNPMLASFRDYLPQINITKTRFYEESMYYLINYGCHSDIVNFLMKNKLISYALKYILLQKVDPSTFIHVVFMPNVKQGNVTSIIDLMTEIDETMLIWKDCIKQTCRYLEVNRLLNTLYQLQNLLQDPIRASMTSVKFYSMQCSTFSDLQTNTFHLINAKKHLQSELELCNWEEIKLNDNSVAVKDNSLSMKMDLKTLNGHINTINRQIEIVKFLAACEQKNGADALRVLSKVSVFLVE
jgi:zinc finger FYVE domain-containing protein 26